MAGSHGAGNQAGTGCVIAVMSEDERFASARREGLRLARRASQPLILYDWDAASLLAEPLPIWWSRDGWKDPIPLDAQQLEALVNGVNRPVEELEQRALAKVVVV